MGCLLCKMKLKELREEEEDDRTRRPPPLSLANALFLQEGPPIPWINRSKATSQAYCFGPRIVFSANITTTLNNQIRYYDQEVLPVDLWGEIGKRLSSRLDILRFRSMCKVWRSSLPSPTRFPIRMPPLPVDPQKVPCIITEVSVYYQSGWDKGFISLEEVDQGGKFYALRRHIGSTSHAKIRDPRIEFTSSWWRRSPVPYDRLSFISKAHHLRRVIPRPGDPTKLVYRFHSYGDKIAIIGSRDGVNPSYVKQSDLSVVALVTKGDMKGRLALLRLKGSSESWAWDTDFCTLLFEDVASHKGRLFAIDPLGAFVIMDFHDSGSLTMTQITRPWPFVSNLSMKLMYEDSGELYLTCFHRQTEWHTYKVDLGKLLLYPVSPPQTEARVAHQVYVGLVL